jgi:hypothetical protein
MACPTRTAHVMRRLRHDDRGVAMAIVLFIGTILILLSTIMITRGFRQLGNTANNQNWDQSLSVAESGLEVGLVELDDDFDWSTGEVIPAGVIGTDAERGWAVSAADARPAEDVETTPEGEFVVVKPSNRDLLFSVAYVPSRDAAERRVRVVRAALSFAPTSNAWSLDMAFLTDDDFTISGNPTFHGDAASGHSNGHLTVSGDPTFHDGCLTASDGGSISGNINDHSDCAPDPYYEPEEFVPEIIPRDFWHMSEYDMCPDGKVRAGPAHPTFGSTAGSTPCTVGHILEDDAGSNPFNGWKFNGCCDSKLNAMWDLADNTSDDGAYYFYQGSPQVSGSPGTNNSPWYVLIVAEAVGSCADHVGGDFVASGSLVIAPYTAGSEHTSNTVNVIAGRDIEWSGDGRLKEPGIIAAREQIKLNGNPQIEGAFIAESECDSADDNVHQTEITGNPTFTLEGPMQTLWFTTQGPPLLEVAGWDEL